MSGILETLAIIAITKAINIGIDYGIRKSKSTKNTVDDYIFAVLGAAKPFLKISNLKNFKFKK